MLIKPTHINLDDATEVISAVQEFAFPVPTLKTSDNVGLPFQIREARGYVRTNGTDHLIAHGVTEAWAKYFHREYHELAKEGFTPRRLEHFISDMSESGVSSIGALEDVYVRNHMSPVFENGHLVLRTIRGTSGFMRYNTDLSLAVYVGFPFEFHEEGIGLRQMEKGAVITQSFVKTKHVLSSRRIVHDAAHFQGKHLLARTGERINDASRSLKSAPLTGGLARLFVH